MTTRISLLAPQLPTLPPAFGFDVLPADGFGAATAVVPADRAAHVVEACSAAGGSDVVVAPARFSPPRLVLMDVDSTLINEEVIEVLAGHAGRRGEVEEITDRAMAGELDFAESLTARVRLLRGVPAGALDEVRRAVTFTPGVPAFVEAVQRRGGTVALVSGGFEEIVRPLVERLGIRHVRANRLQTAEGVLTGEVQGEIVDRAVKAQELRRLAAELEVPLADTIAIGDGANDIDMIEAAGLGIAFCAKPALIARADASVTVRRMDAVYAALTGRVC